MGVNFKSLVVGLFLGIFLVPSLGMGNLASIAAKVGQLQGQAEQRQKEAELERQKELLRFQYELNELAAERAHQRELEKGGIISRNNSTYFQDAKWREQGGVGGGCALSTIGGGNVVEFLLPYLALAVSTFVLKLRQTRNQRKQSTYGVGQADRPENS